MGADLYSTGSKEREDDDGEESKEGEEGEQKAGRSGAQEEESGAGIGKEGDQKDKAGGAEGESRGCDPYHAPTAAAAASANGRGDAALVGRLTAVPALSSV